MKNKPFLDRLGFAWHGLRSAVQHEKSFRTQLYFAAMTLVIFLILQPDLIWWAIIILMIALVLAAELVNTSLEHLADHLHPEEHPKIKLVKDCAATSVLLLSFAAAIIGCLAIVSTLG